MLQKINLLSGHDQGFPASWQSLVAQMVLGSWHSVGDGMNEMVLMHEGGCLLLRERSYAQDLSWNNEAIPLPSFLLNNLSKDMLARGVYLLSVVIQAKTVPL